MFAYEEKRKVQRKSVTGNVVQRLAATARDFRTVATAIKNDMIADEGVTVAVSNNRFAITPLANQTITQGAVGYSGKAHAGPVPGGFIPQNHAERKLIHHDAGLTEIGVSRRICNTCLPKICERYATINHVADPDSIYAVEQHMLRGVNAAGVNNGVNRAV